MTTLDDLQPLAAGLADAEHLARFPRLIGIGVRDYDHDAAAIEWAAAEARPGDEVHVVHAYLPLGPEGCAWEPVSRTRGARQMTASRSVAQALQRIRTVHPNLPVAGSAIAGLPDDVLGEISDVVDLLVIGDDSSGPSRAPKIAWRVQDAARCPVVCISPGNQRAYRLEPVTVIADDRGLSEAAMSFAADEATRRRVTMLVSRTWESLHEGDAPGAIWLAHQHEELDTQLADWRDQYPHLAIASRLELGERWLTRLRSASSLVIAGSDSAGALRHQPSVTSNACPTVVVPDRHPWA